MTATIDRLLRQAHLFEDPSAYEAGVRDALEALAAGDGRPGAGASPQTAARSA